MSRLAAALGCGLLAIFLIDEAGAQRLDSAITIGHGTRLWSKTLQEERRLLIHLPRNYHRSTERYPVLYLLDAEAHFHHATGIVSFLAADNLRIPELIVVGVTNTHRLRDMTPAINDPQQRKLFTGAGGADAFLTFLETELAPWVDASYRTQPYRLLVGHSFGGLFAVNALLTRPASFQAYFAISPSLWWDNRAMVEQAKARIGHLPAGRHYLRLTWGDNEAMIRNPTTELIEWLETHPPPEVQWSSRYYAGDDHGSTPHRSLYDGLEDLFADWRPRTRIDAETEHLGLDAIEAHYAKLSQRYGFTVKPTADAVDQVAAHLMKRKEPAAALPLLTYNVREYPWLPIVHERLGDVLAELDRPEDARRAYEQALQLRLAGENPYRDPLDAYREKIKKLPADAARRH